MKLLVTSVGSLLGQNILDCIESRRSQIEVIGMNSMAENQRNFRCDKVYLVSNTDSPYFFDEFKTIVDNENPDFILPGRDADCIFLAEYKSLFPDGFSKKIPFGSSFIPKIVIDKYLTHLFCKKNQLAFADTFLYTPQTDPSIVNEFVEKHGFPLIVKPREGFGSHGVYFVLNSDQLSTLVAETPILLQEYLGQPDNITKHANLFSRGIPLFFQVTENEQYAAQTIISPDGTIGKVFISINTMIQGRAELIQQIENEAIEKLVVDFCTVFFKNGWYGPLNFQLKPDINGNWKVFELNPRLTGTSSARTLLGYDEFGILATLFIPEFNIENLSKPVTTQGQVIKYLHDNLIQNSDIDLLNKNKVWTKY
jgi:carbamoylphosphate synthase large subunit